MFPPLKKLNWDFFFLYHEVKIGTHFENYPNIKCPADEGTVFFSLAGHFLGLKETFGLYQTKIEISCKKNLPTDFQIYRFTLAFT